MKALILNSGLGSRMGELTAAQPKCMTEIGPGETILSRQLRMLAASGISQVVMTTGYCEDALVKYCEELGLPLSCTFVRNPRFRETNYSYSIYLAREALDGDLLLMHGDLVFDREVLNRLLACPDSCMAVSSAVPLPEKDFKAVVQDGFVQKVGIEFFDSAVAAQALYKLNQSGWKAWLDRICAFCEAGKVSVYAENALNELDGEARIFALDVGPLLCAEVDNASDLAWVREKLEELY